MLDAEWNAIRPGAPKAKDLGCTCPEKQPYHKSQGAYFQDPNCTVHGNAHKFTSMGFVAPCPPTSPAVDGEKP